jgi:hypothetical protein
VVDGGVRACFDNVCNDSLTMYAMVVSLCNGSVYNVTVFVMVCSDLTFWMFDGVNLPLPFLDQCIIWDSYFVECVLE